MKPKMLLVTFIIAFLFSNMVLNASDPVAPMSRLDPIPQEYVSDMSKPGGIVIGPAMPRAFHYGGRHAVRDTSGIIHVSWEDPTYDFNYYSHSLDTLGLTWTEPINPHLTYGVESDGELVYELDRALMAKMDMDPRTGYLYMMPFHRVAAGEDYRTGISRSTDGGETWSPYIDLGTEIGRTDEEVSWGTFTIGPDPDDPLESIFHIAYAKANVDIMYTRAELSIVDAAEADLKDLVFTQSDGTTPGDEAISFVPSGVVFQGTIVLDRNNDPHVIFSGDGGSDTFGDKTPYHIYYKSEVDAWGPIPPQQLKAELETCWGMPEMVFDANNRGYYFLDNNPGTFTFGTWEPPAEPTSATDFGTLNGTGTVFDEYGAHARDLVTDPEDDTQPGFPNVGVTVADQLYLPNADVDDVNDIIYVVGNTNSFSSGNGGDIVILALEDASTYLHTTTPEELPWTLYRRLTDDGIALGDVGPDVIYDPASSHLDVFWSAAGPTDNEAQFFFAEVPPVDVDAQAQVIAVSIPGDKIYVNQGDTLGILGVLKNNGLTALAPIPVTASVLDTAGIELYSLNKTAPPMLPGASSDTIPFGTWVVDRARQDISIVLETTTPGDEATFNDKVGTSFFAYPDTASTVSFESFSDTTYRFPTYEADGTQIIDPFAPDVNENIFPANAFAGGWTVVDSSNGPFGDERDDYISTWFINDGLVDDDLGAYIRHMIGAREDSLIGDIEPDTLASDSAYAQPQNELLYSPLYVVDGSGPYSLEWDDDIDGTDGDYNFPVYAWVDYTDDGGTTWTPVYHRSDTVGGAEGIDDDEAYLVFDLTTALTGADTVQFRFWWRNPNNDASFATWFIDNVYFMGSGEAIITPPLSIAENRTLPSGYAIHQNYPNPFNPSTSIRYDVPHAGEVSIEVYNLLGEHVASLVDGYVTSGRHEVRFNGSRLASGVYFYRLTAEGVTITKKMLLLK